MLVNVESTHFVKTINTVKINVKQLPWKGKVKLLANTAHYNKFYELVFKVVCTAQSPEEGRVYTVQATTRNSYMGALEITHTAQVVGYCC